MRIVILFFLTIFVVSCTEQSAEQIKSPVKNSVAEKTSEDSFKIVIGTFRGNAQRNYYGNEPPAKLNLKWKIHLGKGKSSSYRKGGNDYWEGAGWTGQPLLTRENDTLYLYQGSLDYNLKKINATDGRILWQYKFDDVIKGTGSLSSLESVGDMNMKHVIIQGSRRGYGTSLGSKDAFSLRAISALTGKEIWRYNVPQTHSVSRDVDGSPLILRDTLYAGLENGILSVLNPIKTTEDIKWREPEVIDEFKLFGASKGKTNIVIESSPVLLGNHIFLATGAGYVYGMNPKSKEIDWEFHIGSDLNGTPAITQDSCLLIPIEKQHIPGNGGLLKLNPAKDPEESVVWFLPTGNKSFLDWQGGIVGSPAVNTLYSKVSGKSLAAVNGIDGYLYLIDTDSVISNEKVTGFDGKSLFATPIVYDKFKMGASISSPLMINDAVIAGGYNGLHLFRITPELKLELVDLFRTSLEATPIVYDGRIYVGSRDGYLYCFGD